MNGCKRPGAPKKPSHIKKASIHLKLPGWLLAKIAGLKGSRAVVIEDALCKVHKWEKPD